MFVDLFIRRPILSIVVSLLIVLVGVLCIPILPVAEFPSLQPPHVSISASYLGASTETVETSVTTPLELAINGTVGLRYMSSYTTSGSTGIDATFEPERDPDLAVLDVQNHVNRALGLLPPPVRQLGVSVDRRSGAYLLTLALDPTPGVYDTLFLSNYADNTIVEDLKRVPGVANCFVEGQRKYALRVWLDPLRLAARKLTARDVVNAISEQNVQISAGVIGAQPADPGQVYEIPVRALGRLSTPEEFGALVLKNGAAKNGSDGTLVQLRDVARVELGAEDYSSLAFYRGVNAVAVGVTVLAGANALDVRNAVLARMRELRRSFPPGLDYEVPFDSTQAVSASLRELVLALLGSIALVILVILFFLQSFRGTLIAAIALPVSLLGTFAFVKLFGFSINTLTLFGLTLATGLVVDDAIVVIENIQRHLEEGDLNPRLAASRGMREVTGAVLATSLVLIAVFVPMAFFPGFTGRLYKQFALTVAFSVAISTFTALTLTPSLAALLLRAGGPKRGLFAVAERSLKAVSARYARSLTGIERHWPWALTALAIGLAGTFWLARTLPRTLVPQEDRSYFSMSITAPEGASFATTSQVVREMEKVFRDQPEVRGFFSWVGDGASNRASGFVMLKPIAERPGDEHSLAAVVRRVRKQVAAVPGALIEVFPPAPIEGLGQTGGLELQVLDEGGGSIQSLAEATQSLVSAAGSDPMLEGVYTDFAANDPQLLVDVDRVKAKGLGVSLDEIADALEIELGSAYVNDFEMNNRAYRVLVQADQQFRAEPKSLDQLYVRSSSGAMLPLQSVIHRRETTAPQVISHYNLFRTAGITLSPAPGVSSGSAMREVEKLATSVLPAGIGFAWTGIALEELTSQRLVALLFSLTLLFVFLVLAALYESFVLPLIILLAVPLALLGALGAQALRGLTNDLFCQLGLVMLVGLASKNAILIVEFAEQLRGRGRSIVEAAVEASRERLRPILMTSFAFILGMLPLVFAGEGAGANSRRSLGTAVAAGMIVSTLLNLLVTPVLYAVIQGLRERVLGSARAQVPNA